ncbi:MAG: hypothetical protein ABW090_00400 [Sedimenticola sp.]
MCGSVDSIQGKGANCATASSFYFSPVISRKAEIPCLLDEAAGYLLLLFLPADSSAAGGFFISLAFDKNSERISLRIINRNLFYNNYFV